MGANLVYQTSMPIASLLVQPFTAVSLPFAYNLIFFAGFCLSGLTMFILARYLTKNSYAAFIAGIIFAFSTFHIAQSYGHLEYTNIEWMPLALYFFLRIVREDHGRLWKALAVSVCMVLACFTGDIEMGMVLILLFVIISVLYLLGKESRKRILNWASSRRCRLRGRNLRTRLLGLDTDSRIARATRRLRTPQRLSDMPTTRSGATTCSPSSSRAHTTAFSAACSLHQSYIYHGDISETASYLTYTAIVLALLGLWKHFKENRLWLVLAVLFFLLALGPVLLVNRTLPAVIGGGTGITGMPLPYQLYQHDTVLQHR